MSTIVEHTVSSCDSLANIAMRYGCTVQEIMRLNRLTTTDIWMKKTLKVPVQTKEPIKEWDPEMELMQKRNADVSSLAAAANIEPQIAREILEEHNWDFKFDEVLISLRSIQRLARDCGVADIEAKAYWVLAEGSYDRAKRLLIEDLKWEKENGRKAATYKKYVNHSEIPLSSSQIDPTVYGNTAEGRLLRDSDMAFMRTAASNTVPDQVLYASGATGTIPVSRRPGADALSQHEFETTHTSKDVLRGVTVSVLQQNVNKNGDEDDVENPYYPGATLQKTGFASSLGSTSRSTTAQLVVEPPRDAKLEEFIKKLNNGEATKKK